jgi:hypothetical protein
MARAPEVFEFRPGASEAVTDAMDELTAAQRGWITLQPGVRPEDAPPPRSLMAGLFSGTGPPVPVCTWVAPQPNQKPPHPEIGILHRAGPKVVKRLAAAGIDVPEHWVVLADHPKRGLVVAVHPESPVQDALDFLLAAATALTLVPFTGSWQATVNHG